MSIDAANTQAVKMRYDRIASIYDLVEEMMEGRVKEWRSRAWSLVQGRHILEVGVGTGRNIPYHPEKLQITGIDISDRMLARAQERLKGSSRSTDLRQMDAQAMDFPDDSFDGAIATCVFCSVPDPVQGLREVKRVVKPGGSLVLLEHGQTNNALLNRLLDVIDPLMSPLMGAHINRDTLGNIRSAGIEIERVEYLSRTGMFKLIVARVGKNGNPATGSLDI